LVGLIAGGNRLEIAGGQTGVNDRQFFTDVADGQEPDEWNRKNQSAASGLGRHPDSEEGETASAAPRLSRAKVMESSTLLATITWAQPRMRRHRKAWGVNPCP